MKANLITVILVLIAALALGSAVQAGILDWHEANSFGWADKNNQKHPTKLTLGVLNPKKDNSSSVCIWYLNNHAKENKGKVTAKCELTRQDMSVQKVNFSETLKDNWVCECKGVGAVEAGDALMCSFNMKKFPKLKATQADWNFIDIAAAFVANGTSDWCR